MRPFSTEDWYVFRLKDRTEATDENYTEDVQARIRSQLVAAKQAEVLRAYVRDLRERARDDGALRIEDSVLAYGDEEPESDGEDEDEEEEEEGGEEEAEPAEEEAS